MEPTINPKHEAMREIAREWVNWLFGYTKKEQRVSNVDWTEPIEYVPGGGRALPARLLGRLKGNGKYPYFVAVDYGDTEGIVDVSEDGRSSTGARIRNIPEPKREPRVVWVWENKDGTVGDIVLHENPSPENTQWRKFVEEV